VFCLFVSSCFGAERETVVIWRRWTSFGGGKAVVSLTVVVWRIWCSDVYGVVVVLEGMIMVDE
jgi:hypothetical protein